VLLAPGGVTPGAILPGAAAPVAIAPAPQMTFTPGAAAQAVLPPSAAGPAAPMNASPLAANAAAPTPSLAGAAPAAGSGAVASAAPNMIGDFGVGAAGQLRGVSRSARVPLVARGGFKVAENESPRPQDRIFFNYNFFNNVTVYETGFDPLTGNSRPRGQDLERGPVNFNLHRETFGFEKTFLGGDASIGLRVPIQQKDGLGGVALDGFGDLTLVSKFALINNRETGDVLSGGLALTVPTGRSIILANDERLDAVLFQPWVGFLVNSDRLYVQGFSSLIASSSDLDITFLTADVGVGYKLWTGGADNFLTSFTPTVELHANIPLEDGQVSQGGVIVFPDQFITTVGAHLGIGQRATATVGMAIPLSGPKPFDFELLVQFNVRF
jgi:hypothetical protein